MRNRVQNDQPVIVPVATYPTLPQNGPMPQPRPDTTMGAPMAPANPVAPIAPTVPAPATGQMRANAGMSDIRGFTPSELAVTARGMYKEPGNAFSAFGQGMMNASALRDQRQREMELADREEAKKQAELAKQQAEQAKQIDYLDRMSPELADAARNGFMTPQEAYTAFRTERANGGKREWTTLDNGDYGWRNAETGAFEVIGNAAKPSTPTDDMREYDAAVAQGYEGTIQDWIMQTKKAGATTVNVGDGAPGLGKLSTDFGYVLDPETGKPKVDPETGLPRAAAIPGSPAQIEAERLVETKRVGKESAARSGNVVLEDIDRALEGLDQGLLPTSGPVGGVLSNVPGTQAFNVGQLIQTVKANSGFDRLQAMRDSSPTGGALGAINKSEMDLLQAALGNLSQSQDEEQLRYNLKRVRRIYDEIVNGPDAGADPSPAEGQSPPEQQGAAQAPQPASKDEFDALPSGTKFLAPDGSMRVKP
jgi:hypothetical protein